MNKQNQLTIAEFSRLTGIKRENLRFYDRIGLLSPEKRGANNYRYYSRHQLSLAYLIGNLRGLGVGIEEIKRYDANRTPESTLALYAKQEERIQREISQLQETSLILKMSAQMICKAMEQEENALFLEKREAEPIFICPPIPFGMSTDDGSVFSYDYAEQRKINLGFPQGTFIAQERMEGDDTFTDQYYFKVNRGSNEHKPAGLYAVAYGRMDPWKSEPLYQRLLHFIKEQGMVLAGGVYEEYPFGDISGEDMSRFCLRLEAPVKHK